MHCAIDQLDDDQSRDHFPVLHCASLMRITTRLISARGLKMAAFSLRLDLAIEVNRLFPENEYGGLFCCFELSNKFLCVE